MKKKIALLLLLVLFSLTACTKQSITTTKDLKVYTGTDGIVMNFIQSTPPSIVYSSDTLNFLLEVRNKGTYAAGTKPNNDDGPYEKFLKIYISGFDNKILTGSIEGGKDPVFEKAVFRVQSLNPKSEFNPEGGITYKDFSTKIENLPEGLDSFKTNFLVTACYNYETHAITSVCIDPKPYSTAIKEKACTIQDISLSGGQGAPVAVTKIEEEASKDKVRFKIYIENEGNGKIFDTTPGKRSAKDSDGVTRLKCNPQSEKGLGYDDVDKIRLEKVSLGGEEIPLKDCKPSIDKVVRLIDGKGFIICEKEVTGNSAYTTPIEIKFSYGYTSSIKKEIEILKPLE